MRDGVLTLSGKRITIWLVEIGSFICYHKKKYEREGRTIMKEIRVIRNLLMIFFLSVIAMFLLTLVYGVEYDRSKIGLVVLVGGIYAVMALGLFSERLDTKRKFAAAQVVYVIGMNVSYGFIIRFAGLHFAGRAYLYNAVLSIVLFTMIKTLIFSIDKGQAERVSNLH